MAGKDSRFKHLEFENKIKKQLEDKQISIEEYNQIVLKNLVKESYENYMKGEFDDALILYGRMLDYDRSKDKPWIGQVASLIRAYRFEEAKTCVNNGLDEFPNSSVLLAQKGVILAYLDNPQQAFEYSDASLEDITTPLIYIYRGELLLILGRIHDANSLFYKAFEDAMENVLLHFEIGLIYYYHKQYSNALFHLNKVIELHGTNAFLLFKLGECQEKLGFTGKAQNLYKEATVIDPLFKKAYEKIIEDKKKTERAKMFIEVRNFIRNIRCFWKERQSNPDPYHAGIFAIIPCLGQIYNNQLSKALFFVTIYIVIIIICLSSIHSNPTRALEFFLFIPVIYGASILDAVITVLRKKEDDFIALSIFRISGYVLGFIIILIVVCWYLINTYLVSFWNFFGVPTKCQQYLGFAQGDRIMINRLVYRWSNPKVNDTVETRIARGYSQLGKIIALPGEDVKIKNDNGNFFVNNEFLFNITENGICLPEYNYLTLENRAENDICNPQKNYFVLEKDEYLVVNNRLQVVNKVFFVGKVTQIFYPPSRRKEL